MRCLCHVMQQAESSRDTVQRRKNSCLRDAFVFFLWHTSRHQPIAEIGGRCRSRADNLQRGTVEAGRVTPCTQERLTWSQCAVELVTSATPEELVWYAPVFQFSWSVGQRHSAPTGVSAAGYRQFHTAGCYSSPASVTNWSILLGQFYYP